MNKFKEHYSSACQHRERQICNLCVYKATKYSLNESFSNDIVCLEIDCAAILSKDVIHQILIANNDVQLWRKYELYLAKKSLQETQNFVRCSYEDCGSGQVYDVTRSYNNRIVCLKYHRPTCSYHGIKWHIGMTCTEYDEAQEPPDEETGLWLKTNSKRCPRCQSHIEKRGGCNHMTCRKCRFQFNWKQFDKYQ